MQMQMEVPDVFLCHAGNRAQKAGIVSLVYEELKRRGITNVFFDKESLKTGEPVAPHVIRGVATAKVVVVFLSPEFLCREWTLKELEIALARDNGASPRREDARRFRGRKSFQEFLEQKLSEREQTLVKDVEDGIPGEVLPLYFHLSPEDISKRYFPELVQRESVVASQFVQWSMGEEEYPRRWKTALTALKEIKGPRHYPEADQTEQQYAEVVANWIEDRLPRRSRLNEPLDTSPETVAGNATESSGNSPMNTEAVLERKVDDCFPVPPGKEKDEFGNPKYDTRKNITLFDVRSEETARMSTSEVSKIARDDQDETPLITYVKKSELGKVHMLLKRWWEDKGHVDDVNARDRRKLTALHHAAHNGCIELAKLLLKRGADVLAKDEHFRTPKLCAKKNNKREMVDLLSEAEKRVITGKCAGCRTKTFKITGKFRKRKAALTLKGKVLEGKCLACNVPTFETRTELEKTIAACEREKEAIELEDPSDEVFKRMEICDEKLKVLKALCEMERYKPYKELPREKEKAVAEFKRLPSSAGAKKAEELNENIQKELKDLIHRCGYFQRFDMDTIIDEKGETRAFHDWLKEICQDEIDKVDYDHAAEDEAQRASDAKHLIDFVNNRCERLEYKSQKQLEEDIEKRQKDLPSLSIHERRALALERRKLAEKLQEEKLAHEYFRDPPVASPPSPSNAPHESIQSSPAAADEPTSSPAIVLSGGRASTTTGGLTSFPASGTTVPAASGDGYLEPTDAVAGDPSAGRKPMKRRGHRNRERKTSSTRRPANQYGSSNVDPAVLSEEASVSSSRTPDPQESSQYAGKKRKKKRSGKRNEGGSSDVALRLLVSEKEGKCRQLSQEQHPIQGEQTPASVPPTDREPPETSAEEQAMSYQTEEIRAQATDQGIVSPQEDGQQDIVGAFAVYGPRVEQRNRIVCPSVVSEWTRPATLSQPETPRIVQGEVARTNEELQAQIENLKAQLALLENNDSFSQLSIQAEAEEADSVAAVAAGLHREIEVLQQRIHELRPQSEAEDADSVAAGLHREIEVLQQRIHELRQQGVEET